METASIPSPKHRAAVSGLWRRRLAMAALGGALVTALTACAVVPAQPQFVGEVVRDPPPPVQAEVIGVAPAPGYIWIGGYWNWVGGRHVWIAGHWAPPRAGYHWVPHAWIQTGAGWHLREGHWAQR